MLAKAGGALDQLDSLGQDLPLAELLKNCLHERAIAWPEFTQAGPLSALQASHSLEPLKALGNGPPHPGPESSRGNKISGRSKWAVGSACI
jgi:hypothetical protein